MTSLPGSPVEWAVLAWVCLGLALTIVGYAWCTRHIDDPLSDTDRYCAQVDEDLDQIGGTR
jgi:hypothetical protein